jgi:beta-galactosidase/beta-glucuronidase
MAGREIGDRLKQDLQHWPHIGIYYSVWLYIGPRLPIQPTALNCHKNAVLCVSTVQ